MKDLITFTEIASSFTDYTQEARDFIRDPITETFNAGDKIYLGLYKPFNSFYVELQGDVTPSNISFKYSNTASFKALSVTDDTRSLSRSGFIDWQRNIEDWQETVVNGQKAFWVEIEFNDTYSLAANGINIVFSSDYQMQIKSPFIMDYLAKSDTSFIRNHVAARDEIVQLLRNGGYIKMPFKSGDLFFESSDDRKNITKWDILDREEIREAATFKAMALVFFNESRNVDDKEYNLYRQYQGMFGQSFKLFYLSLDKNDNGIEEDSERLANNEITVVYE